MQRLEESTRTVSDAAVAVGCQEAEIAKSIVFVADGDPVVCVASGRHRIDADKLADALDWPRCARRPPTRCAPPPASRSAACRRSATTCPVILDEALLEHERVWAAAGDPHSLFAVDPRELARCTHARIARVGAVDEARPG